ncbi:MAG: trypsin-like serine protease, partial [Polyangiaceae bacterium]
MRVASGIQSLPIVVLSAILVCLGGCAGDGYDQPEGTGSSSAAIINGGAGSPQTGDVKLVTTTNNCSGTMVNNIWFLTDMHCFDGSVLVAQVVDVTVHDTTLGDDAAVATKIAFHPSLDVALVLLAQPEILNGSSGGFV